MFLYQLVSKREILLNRVPARVCFFKQVACFLPNGVRKEFSVWRTNRVLRLLWDLQHGKQSLTLLKENSATFTLKYSTGYFLNVVGKYYLSLKIKMDYLYPFNEYLILPLEFIVLTESNGSCLHPKGSLICFSLAVTWVTNIQTFK